jgi:DNA-binding transcriptional ArsR family regulator
MSTERPIEEILDTMGDQHARRVLIALSQSEKSAKDLRDETGLSLPTIYRRIEMLKEHDLVGEKTIVAEDGNHYRVFECNFDSTLIRLSDDEFDIRIYRTENLPSRFDNLWDDLSRTNG